MRHKRTHRGIAPAGAVLAAGLIPLAATPVAHADGGDGGAGADPVLISHTDNFGLFTDTGAAGNFLADIFQIPDMATFGSEPLDSVSDPDFISNIHDFGLFTVTSAADPDDDFVAFVFQTPLFTDILTSGADPEGNLGLGDAGIGVAGETVNTFIVPSDPALDSTLSLPFPDPLADLFTLLVQLGF